MAYRACFRCAGLSEKNIANNAKLILAKPNVVIRLEQMLRDAAMISSIDKARVLQHIADIAFAKASDFIKITKYCCRYCHGFNNKYQWRDSEEFEEAVLKHAREQAIYEALPDDRRRLATPPKTPSDEGGYEFQQFLPPNRHCDECNGAGREELEYKDIDSIPKSSLALFAGAKRGKYGVELILKDQTAHLRMLAEALGLFIKKVELSTPEGGLQMSHTMAPAQLANMPSEELETLQALLMKALQPSDNSVVDVVAKPAARDPSNIPTSE